MGLTKVIQSGTVVEVYQYDRFPSSKLRFLQRDKCYKHLHRRLDNLRSVKNSFRRLVLSNIGGGFPQLFTFTFRGEVRDIYEGYAWLKSFHMKLRYRFGKDFSFIVVPEFGTKNTKRLHFHGLYWGLPDLCVSERSTRFVASLWRQGWVDCCMTDGSLKLASYMAKYLMKALVDDRLNGQKAYVCSRNIKRPVSLTMDIGSLAFTYLDDIVGVDNFPLLKREYNTQWMGTCVYKQYNL